MLLFILTLLNTFACLLANRIDLFDYVNTTYLTHNYNDDYCNDQPVSPIVNTIRLAKEYGIDIFSEDSLDAYKDNILGGYRLSTRNIILYNTPELENFNDLHDSTLKHELIHAIQHCKGRGQRLSPLINYISLIDCVAEKKINVNFIKSYYSKEDVPSELDAYCLENDISYEEIDVLLNKFCKKSTQM
jgi:hypothetical protein